MTNRKNNQTTDDTKMSKIDLIIESLGNLNLLESRDLVKELERIFNVDTSIPSQPTPVAGAAGAAAISTPEIVEEKTSFDILLTQVPADKKIPILKIIRTVTGLGLKESKEIVDNIPKLIKAGTTKEESETIKKELEAAGATVTIK
jgi:large subunit ribosomal protein L7/L12